MEKRLQTLEEKVDKYSELMSRMITNQELMQAEVTLMRKTLESVGDLKTAQLLCATETRAAMKALTDRMDRSEVECDDCRDRIDGRFSKRDGWLATVAAGLVVAAIIGVATFMMGHKPL